MGNNDFMDYLARLMIAKDIINYYNFIFNTNNTDIKNYEKEVNTIESTVKELVKNNSNISFDEYIKRLDEIIKDIEDRYQVTELIREYLKSISDSIDNISISNYEEILSKIKKLITYMEHYKVYELESNSGIIDEVSKVIYQGLLNEAIISKNNILEEVLKISNPILKEKIGMLLVKDIVKLSADDRMDIELNYINQGSPSNNLNSETIKKISDSVYSDKCVDFRKGKQTVLMELLEQNDKLVMENKVTTDNYKRVKDSRNSYLRKLYMVRLKVLSLILIPIMTALTGGLITANRNSERLHKIVTKSYNMNTNNPIGDEESNYVNAIYNFKVNIKKYGPWIKKELGSGYMREVLEYNYTEYDDTKEVDVESVLNNVVGKSYVEETEEIVETENIEAVITETRMDKSDSKPDVGGIVSIAILALLAGVVIDSVLLESKAFKDINDYSDIEERADESKIVVKKVEESFVKIGNKVLKLQEEYDRQTLTYGDLEREINPELIKTARKYGKR